MMKKLGKKILSYIFAVCMLVSSFGDPRLYVFADPGSETPALIPITITAGSATKTYDGEALTMDSYTLTAGALQEGHHFGSVTVTGSQTDAGTSNNVPSAAYIYAIGEDTTKINVTDQYDIAYAPGTLTVEPKGVTLTANSANYLIESVGDAEQTVTGYTCSVSGLTFVGVSASGSGTGKGVYPVTFSGVTEGVTRDATENYVVASAVAGQLIISEHRIIEKSCEVKGDLAHYTIRVNQGAEKLNNEDPLILKDTFDDGQSIIYSTILVDCNLNCSYDYSGYTGTFTIPDGAAATITYTTRIKGDPGASAHVTNTAVLGKMDGGKYVSGPAATVVNDIAELQPGSDIAGTGGQYAIQLFVYPEGHMERGLGGASFRLLDHNKKPITYTSGPNAGDPVTFTTGDNGYVTVESCEGLTIHKNTAYYLEMTVAPFEPGATYTYYQKDNTYYSFLITDDPNYTYGGVYSYYNGDTLKVRCYEQAPGVNITLRFAGNYALTQAQKERLRFTLQKENLSTGEWDDVTSLDYSSFKYDSASFKENGETLHPEVGATYRIIEENTLPQELQGRVTASVTTTVSYQIDDVPRQDEGNEFYVEPTDVSTSYNFTFTNEYVEKKLTVVVLDEDTGEKLSGATFGIYQAGSETQLAAYTTQGEDGLSIRRNDGVYAYEQNTLYYALQLTTPAGHILPETRERIYFYFGHVTGELPSGATDLSATYNTVVILNSGNTVDIPVTVTWGHDGTDPWPDAVDRVVLALYRNEETKIGSSITLTKSQFYNTTAFKNLPTMIEGQYCHYSLAVEGIFAGELDIQGQFAGSDRISGTGWYVMNIQKAVSIEITAKWLDKEGQPTVKNGELPYVLYRTDAEAGTPDPSYSISHDNLDTVLKNAEEVQRGTLCADNGWITVIDSLPERSNNGSAYFYYILETVPDNQEVTYTVTPAQGIERRKLTVTNQQTLPTVTVKVRDTEKTFGDDTAISWEFDCSVAEEGSACTYTGPDENGRYTVTVTPASGTPETTFQFTVNFSWDKWGTGVGEHAVSLQSEGAAQAAGYRVLLKGGTLTVKPAEITVKTGAVKTYGEPDPPLATVTATVGSIAQGDEIGDSVYQVIREQGQDAGEYTISFLRRETDPYDGKYHVTYDDSGKFIINKAVMTITADNMQKIYGDDDPLFTATIEGLKNNDSPDRFSYEVVRAPGENVGEYVLTPVLLTVSNNYISPSADAGTLKTGTLTIKPTQVQVIVQNAQKDYGSPDPQLTIDIIGLKGDDVYGEVRFVSIDDDGITQHYKYVLAGETDLLTFALKRDAGEDKGEYQFKPVDGFPAGGDKQGNYSVVFGSLGSLSIQPAALTVTANRIVRALGSDTVPQLTATVTQMKYQPGSPDPVATVWAQGTDYDSATVNEVDVTEGEITYKRYTWKYYKTDIDAPILTFTLKRENVEETGMEYTVTPEGDPNQGNFTVSYENGTYSVLSMLTIDVSQTISDMVDPTADPQFDYEAEVDLRGSGMSAFIDEYNKFQPKPTENGYVYTYPFSLGGNGDDSVTFRVPALVKLTVRRIDNTDPSDPTSQYNVSHTSNGVQANTGECVINGISTDHSILFRNERICLPVQARGALTENGDTVYDIEQGAVPAIPTVYVGIPENEEHEQAINDLFVIGMEPRYQLPEGMSYKYHHAALFADGYEHDGHVAEVDGLKYDTGRRTWMYLPKDGTEYKDVPAGGQLVLFYVPEFICRVGENEFFHTLNEALGSLTPDGDGHAVATIELLNQKYTMPASDALTVPAGYEITLTSAGETPCTISRKANFTVGAMLESSGKLTLKNIILDGNRDNVTAVNAMVRCKTGGVLTIEDTATLRNAKGGNGGAIYVDGGTVTVNGILNGNYAVNGGAVYVYDGTVTLSSNLCGDVACIRHNEAVNGGTVYVAGGTVTVNGILNGNYAENGGAAYVSGGVLNLAGKLNYNSAVNGGAVYINGGEVKSESEDTKIEANKAANGGGFYTEGGTLTISKGTYEDNTATTGNGGLLDGTGGDITVSGGSVKNNIAEIGNGGAISYRGPGSVTISGGTVQGNKADNGNGGAIYQSSGTVTLSGTINDGNTAKNGAAVFVQAGIANFSGCTITGNIPTQGGAVGIGTLTAKLNFSGKPMIHENRLNGEASGEKRNLYLDQNSDLVINTAGLEKDANIGIYVPGDLTEEGSLVNSRGDACQTFGTYTGSDNLDGFKNDRRTGLTACAYNFKIIWSQGIKVQFRGIKNAGILPPTNGNTNIETLKGDFTYYPKSQVNSIYDLVMEIYNSSFNANDKKSKFADKNYLYAYTYYTGTTEFSNFTTDLNWDRDEQKWIVKRNGLDDTLADTNTNSTQLFIYYAKGTYVSIVNNSGHALTGVSLAVMGKDAVAYFYGYPTVKNYITLDTLLPIEQADLDLADGEAVKLLFPNALGKSWSLIGKFDGCSETQIAYTLDRDHGGTSQNLTTDGEGGFNLSGTTSSSAGGSYEILFGDPTDICKVVDNGVEYPFPTLNAAWNYIKSRADALDDPMTVDVEYESDTAKDGEPVTKTVPGGTIELLKDYLQPESDVLQISDGYCLKLTTAAPAGTAGVLYTYTGKDPTRATISRDTDNDGAAVIAEADEGLVINGDASCDSFLFVENLIFDGKALAKKGNGGAITTTNNVVVLKNCDFKGYQAQRGGAIFVTWGSLYIDGCNFSNCVTGDTSDKTGGGAVWTTARKLKITNTDFDHCACESGKSQAGAVFHNINQTGAVIYNGAEAKYAKFPKNFYKDSMTILDNCRFEDCYAEGGSGGTIESDSLKIWLIGCTFNGSYSNKDNANGGAINILHSSLYNATNDNYTPLADSLLEVIGCTFENCRTAKINSDGGAIHAANTATVHIYDSTFRNTRSDFGGAIRASAKGATVEIKGSTFENCTGVQQGGAIFCSAQTLTIDQYTYTENGVEKTRRTTFTDCTSPKFGGVLQNRTDAGSSVTVDHADFTRCTTTNENAGALSISAQSLTVKNSTFTGCTASKNGGAIYHAATKDSLDTVTFANCSSGDSGGAAYLGSSTIEADTVEVTGCSAVNNGGGMYVKSGGSFTDCTFTGNSVAEAGKGGSLYASIPDSATVTFNVGCTISGGVAAKGGGIYKTDKGTLNMEGTVSDCRARVSGGGLCCDGGVLNLQGTVEDCFAVTSGGGACCSSGTLTVDGSGSIENCFSVQGGGIASEGGTLNMRGTVKDCFAIPIAGIEDDPANYNEDQLTAAKNSADTANLGGGVYSSATMNLSGTVSGCWAYDGGGVYYNAPGKTLTVNAGSSIQGNTAQNRGGGLYKGEGTGKMPGGVIGGESTGNTAKKGAGVFVADGQSFTLSGGSVTHNHASETGGGIAVGGTSSQLVFSGSAKVQNNTMGENVKCNVYLDQDTNGIIRTDGTAALTGSAYIGVYVIDELNVYHGQYSMPFGTFGKTDHLGRFFNDRVYSAGRRGTTSSQIVWAKCVCKITDEHGNLLYTDAEAVTPAVYAELKEAFDALNTSTPALWKKNENGTTTKMLATDPYQIQMLTVEYSLSGQITMGTANRDITLTTADPKAGDGFRFEGGSNQAAVIKRGGNYGSMFYLKVSSNLKLLNITIDGGSAQGYKSTTSGGIALIEGGGTLTIDKGATLQNSDVGTNSGGAVRMQSGTGNVLNLEEGGLITNCKSSAWGGGISVKAGTFYMHGGSITNCTGQYGGGVRVDATMYMSGGSITDNKTLSIKDKDKNDYNGGGGISPGNSSAKIYFSGKCVVKDNYSGNTPCNVCLGYDSNKIINTYGSGLDSDSEIGVYTADNNSIYDKHGKETKSFGTWSTGNDVNLFCFVNDRDRTLRGEKAISSSSTTNYEIVWRQVLALELRTDVDNSLAVDNGFSFTYEVKISGTNNAGTHGDMYFNRIGSDIVATITMKAGASKTAILPYAGHNGNAYTVTLKYTKTSVDPAADYEPSATQNGQPVNPLAPITSGDVTSYTVSGTLGELLANDQTAITSTVTFTHTRRPVDLTVKNTVTGLNNLEDAEKAAALDRSSPFTLQTTDSAFMTGARSYGYAIVDGDGNTVENDTMTFDALGKISFSLKPFQEIRFFGLPKGFKYTVTEDQSVLPDYTRTKVIKNNIDIGVGASASGTLGEQGDTNPSALEFTTEYRKIVCKITNGSGELLRYREPGSSVSLKAVFPTLKEAFDAVNQSALQKEDGTSPGTLLRIQMIVPTYTLKEQVTLEVGRTVTLTTAAQGAPDGFPYLGTEPAVITRGSGLNDSMILNKGALTLDNIVLDGGRVTGLKSEENGGIIRVDSTAVRALTVNNTAVLQNSVTTKNGGAIWLRSGSATLTMNGTIQGCEAEYGGGIYAADTFNKVTVSGTIKECKADYGGGIWAGKVNTAANNVYIGGGTIEHNHAKYGGGIWSGAKVILQNGVIRNNSAEYDGGGIYLPADDPAYAPVEFAMYSSGSTVAGNTASGNGGGLVVQSKATLSGGSIAGNTASGSGGGIYATATAEAAITGDLTFTKNGAKSGGAIYDAGKVTMSSGSIGGEDKGNTASVSGGAVFVADNASFSMSSGSITCNSATGTGGGIAVGGTGSRLVFSGSANVVNNTMGEGANAKRCNVYLDRNTNDVIQTTGLLSAASIGVYVSDTLVNEHGLPGCDFGTYTGTAPGTANLSKFFNDRYSQVLVGTSGAPLASGCLVTWKGLDLQLQVYKGNNEPVNGIKFTLTNTTNGSEVQVWSGQSGESGTNGLVKIPWGPVETSGGKCAAFLKDSTYRLTLTEASGDTVRPAGCWTLTVGADNALTWNVQASAEEKVDRTPPITIAAGTQQSGTLHDTFALVVDTRPILIFKNNSAITRREIGFDPTATYRDYNIEEPDPSLGNYVFQGWKIEGDTSGTLYKHGNTLRLCRMSDNDAEITLIAQWNKVACKITDNNDNLLYVNGSPAVFETLEEGFDAFNHNNFTLDAAGKRAGTPRKIKMLTVEYDLKEDLTLDRSRIPSVILTTAALEESDGYSLQADGSSSTTCTITRREKDGGAASSSMITAKLNLNLVNITLDGGGVTVSGNGGLIHVTGGIAQLTIQKDATLRNASASGSGGAVYADAGNTVNVSGGTITGNHAVNGGGIYAVGGVIMISGSITGNTATGSGGGVYAEGTASVTGGSISNNNAANGGGVYVPSGGRMTLSRGTVSGNSCTGDGAGIHLAAGSTLNLSGSPSFGSNFSSKGGLVQSGDLNGGEASDDSGARQDIYLAETGTDPASLRVTGSIGSAQGSIWVWADQAEHFEMLKPFAVITGTVSAGTYTAFRNARPDRDTHCSSTYLTGQKGSNASYIYWSGGYDVTFRKTDGSGAVLKGAVFTLYKDAACTISAERTSSYDTNDLVLIESVPVGVYYMKETTVPTGYAVPEGCEKYVLLVGEAALKAPAEGEERKDLWASGQVLADITQADIAGQTGGTKQYAIFLLSGGKAVPSRLNGGDVAAKGIVNVSTTNRKVILKKILSSESGKTTLSGAKFDVLYWNGIPVTVGGTPLMDLESGDGGVFWIGSLPAGKYYLHETQVPTNAKQNEGGWWYTLTVPKNAENDVSISGPFTDRPN